MSILNYFAKGKRSVKNGEKSCETLPYIAESAGLSSREFSLVTEEIENLASEKKTRVTYKEQDKLMMARYANQHGPSRTVAKYLKDFPKLKESTLRGWLVKYRNELKSKTDSGSRKDIKIGMKRGRPLSLPQDLDLKLRRFILSLREAGGMINIHVIHGILMGLIKSDLVKYGQYLDFNVTRGWINYLYKRLNFKRRMVTTSRPTITHSIWVEARFIYLNEIAQAVSEHERPDELVINVDQTPPKFVPTDNITMAEKVRKTLQEKVEMIREGLLPL